eukprot:14488027-Heterocapsa_arctica.AAC.1
MIRAGFGLKDAPRAWSMVLTRVLKDFGLSPTKIDTQVFIEHKNNLLSLIVSTHVDDLKRAGGDSERDALIAHMEKEFGKLKTEIGSFIHVGISHEQDVDTKEVYIHLQQYVRQLRPISIDETLFAAPDEPAPPNIAASFLTLLG